MTTIGPKPAHPLPAQQREPHHPESPVPPAASAPPAAPAPEGEREPAAGGLRIGGLRLPALSLPDLPATLPKRALWWGGLAALAVVGVVEWPVAAVVGAGTYVAERLSREDSRAK
jgi:hypothetical protein